MFVRLHRRLAGAILAVLLVAGGLPAGAMSLADARHFAQRTGFAATPDEVLRLLPMTREQAIAEVLGAVRSEPVTPAPAWSDAMRDLRVPKTSPEARRAFLQQRRLETLELRAWWYREMLATPSPLTERMTLFWHNHFATSVRKVRSATLMYRQNLLLRRHAVGSFKSLLAAMPRDPAMVLWLDGATNRKSQPNENFARELLELFTLGEGQAYTERDIKEAARAFTGWSIDRATGAYRFRAPIHDDGEKLFMGQRGRLDGDDIIAILLDHPRTAAFIVEKLWREFVSETPDPAEVARIAARFKASGYDVKGALGELFATPAFWAAENRGRLVRSPVELVVGTMRLFAIAPLDGQTMFNLGNTLGQDVFAPPNVKGWPGGTAWIGSTTLIARQQLLNRLTRPQFVLAAPPNSRPDDAARNDKDMIPKDMTDKDMTDKDMAGRKSTDDDMSDDEMDGKKFRAKPKSPDTDRPPRAARRARSVPGGDVETWFERLPAALKTPEAVKILLLPTAPVQAPSDMADPARFVRDLLLDPTYQLK